MDQFDVSRRAFVVGAATLAAAAPSGATAADTPAPVPARAGVEGTVPFHFDRAAFAAVLARPYEHRQVLAARSFADAREGLQLLRNSIEAYADPMYFAAGPNAFHAAAVFYHGSSPILALDDAMFAKYPLAAAVVKAAGTGKAGIEQNARTNPAATPYGELVSKHGATFFVCNNALSGIAFRIAQQTASPGSPATRADVVAIHDEMVQHFLPGTVLVPAGVAALNAAQEARFTLLPS